MQMRINFFQDKGQLKDQLIHIQERRELTNAGGGVEIPCPRPRPSEGTLLGLGPWNAGHLEPRVTSLLGVFPNSFS